MPRHAPALILTLLLVPSLMFAQGASLYGNRLASGTVLTTATASSVRMNSSGMESLWGNPAGIISPHHEIYADGRVNGAFSTQSQVTPADWQAGVGSIAYLYSFPRSALALSYMASEHTEMTADFGGYESVNRRNLNEGTLSYAHTLGRGLSLGITVGALFGESHSGNLASDAEMDTVYKTLATVARLGVKQRVGVMAWGITMEVPTFGTMTVERPTNVGYQRFDTDYDIVGAPGFRFAAGWDLRFADVELDLYYAAASRAEISHSESIPVGDSSPYGPVDLIDYDDDVLSVGTSAGVQVDPSIRLHFGLRARVNDPDEVTFFQFGGGGSYILNDEVTVYAAGGLMLPYGDGIDGTAYSDLLPFILRAGVLFHNAAEL